MAEGKRIKILYVHHFSNFGGATMSLLYIIEKLDPKVFDAEVLFLGGEGPVVDLFRARGISVHLLYGISIYPHAYGAHMSFISRKPLTPFLRLFQIRDSVKKLLAFFQEHPYDIVHVNTSLLLAVGKAAKISGAKVVWHIRESLHPGIFGLRRLFVRNWIKRYADWIIAISTFEKNAVGGTNKVSIVYNYIDFKNFDKNRSPVRVQKDFKIKTDSYVVCNLGGGVHSKGADVFVKAAALVCKKYENVFFLLVGIVNTNPAKKNLKSIAKNMMGLKRDLSPRVLDLIKKHNLEGRVILTGTRSDIPEILAASDLLVWSATVPHFARPIIEAGAMEKPVVAAGFPNTRESLVPDVTGLLFKPGSHQDLADKIERLYLNRSLGQSLGQKGLELAERKFNSEHNFSKIEEVYLNLMRGRDERIRGHR